LTARRDTGRFVLEEAAHQETLDERDANVIGETRELAHSERGIVGDIAERRLRTGVDPDPRSGLIEVHQRSEPHEMGAAQDLSGGVAATLERSVTIVTKLLLFRRQIEAVHVPVRSLEP
jgi:hypothetical protein